MAASRAVRSSAARRTSTAWGRSSCSGRLRWIRSPRSTWARRSAPELAGHVDQEPDLDPVPLGEADLLEHPAVRRRLARQRLAHPGQLGEEQLEHRTGHQLGDPSAAGGLAVQGAGVEALHQGHVVGGEQRAQQPGDEGGRGVRHIGVEEDHDVAGRGGEAAAMAWPLPPGAARRRPPPGPRPRRAWTAVSSPEPSSSTMTSSTSPSPPWAATNGCTRPHDRADGRALVAGGDAHRDGPAGPAPWPRGPARRGSPRGGRCAPRPRFKQPGRVEAVPGSGYHGAHHPERLRDGPVDVAATSADEHLVPMPDR